MSVLEVRNLKKSFDKDTVVLKGVDFSLEKGETVAIISCCLTGWRRSWTISRRKEAAVCLFWKSET